MAERETVQFQRWPPQIDLWPIRPAEPVMLHQSRNPSLQLSHQVRLGSPASRGRHLSPPSVWPQVMWLGATRRCWRRKGGHRMSVNHSVLLVKLMRFCVTQVITIFSQFFFVRYREHTQRVHSLHYVDKSRHWNLPASRVAWICIKSMTFSKSDEFCFSVVFVGGVLRWVGKSVSETKNPSN